MMRKSICSLALLALMATQGNIMAYTFTNNNEDLTVDVLTFTSSAKALVYLRAIGWTNKTQVEVVQPSAQLALISFVVLNGVTGLMALPATLLVTAPFVFGGVPATKKILVTALTAKTHLKIPYEETVSWQWQDIRKKNKDLESVRLIVFDNKTGTLLGSCKCGLQADVGFFGPGDMAVYYGFTDAKGTVHVVPEKEGLANGWKLIKPWEKK